MSSCHKCLRHDLRRASAAPFATVDFEVCRHFAKSIWQIGLHVPLFAFRVLVARAVFVYEIVVTAGISIRQYANTLLTILHR